MEEEFSHIPSSIAKQYFSKSTLTSHSVNNNNTAINEQKWKEIIFSIN